MSQLESFFGVCLPVDPLGGQIDAQLAAVADKPAVYLLATEDRQPILLASGLAVRTILRRRLGEPLSDEPDTNALPDAGAVGASVPESPEPIAQGPGTVPPGISKSRLSKRADLRPLVRRLYLRFAFSRFETDLWYLWLARSLFPDRYRRMVRARHSWMIHADPADRIPRLVVTDRFSPEVGRRVGPMAERQSATRLVDLTTGLFRLCHYYQVLRQSPHGRPCEYKEMGRCSGPCDGTVSLDEYRRQVADAMDFLADAGRSWRAQQTDAMKQAARQLDFEAAARIKDRLARAAELDNPKYRWLGDAGAMDFLIVQPGRAKAELKTFRSFAGRIVVGPTLTRKSPAEKLAQWLELPAPADDPPLHAEEAGLLTDYLFHSETGRGAFVRFTGQSAAQLADVVAAVFPPTVRKRNVPSRAAPPERSDVPH